MKVGEEEVERERKVKVPWESKLRYFWRAESLTGSRDTGWSMVVGGWWREGTVERERGGGGGAVFDLRAGGRGRKLMDTKRGVENFRRLCRLRVIVMGSNDNIVVSVDF